MELLSTKHMKEPPTALALAINLQPLPLKDAAQWVQNATEDEIKEHKGIRSTFVIVDMLFSGFTYVSSSDDFKRGGEAKGSKQANGGDPKKERLAVFDASSCAAEEERKSVIFYTYKGESKNLKSDSKKGGGEDKKMSYVKTKRFDECAAISPGKHH